MRSLRYATILTLFVICGCGGDGDDTITPTGTNQVAYDNTSYSLENGLANDYGTIDSDNHYNIDFSVSDGLFIPFLVDIGTGILVQLWSVSEGTIEVHAELYSPGPDGFKTGTFAYTPLPEDEIEDPSLIGQYFFQDAYVAVDADGDQVLSEDEEITVTGGTIEVSGTSPRYTVMYNLALANGKTLRGSFSDEFAVDE
jgi:hypothetical protein